MKTGLESLAENNKDCAFVLVGTAPRSEGIASYERSDGRRKVGKFISLKLISCEGDDGRPGSVYQNLFFFPF